MRRHLVRKSAKAQVVHVSKDHKEPSTRHRKQDRQPHEVQGPGTRGGGGQGWESWHSRGAGAWHRTRGAAGWVRLARGIVEGGCLCATPSLEGGSPLSRH